MGKVVDIIEMIHMQTPKLLKYAPDGARGKPPASKRIYSMPRKRKLV